MLYMVTPCHRNALWIIIPYFAEYLTWGHRRFPEQKGRVMWTFDNFLAAEQAVQQTIELVRWLKCHDARMTPLKWFVNNGFGTETLSKAMLIHYINSVVPGRCGANLKSIIFKLIIQDRSLGDRCEIALCWMPKNLTIEKSTLAQVMAWCRQETSHNMPHVDPNLCHMVSLAHNELKPRNNLSNKICFHSKTSSLISGPAYRRNGLYLYSDYISSRDTNRVIHGHQFSLYFPEICMFLMNRRCFFKNVLTQCGPETPYDVIEQGQFWFIS